MRTTSRYAMVAAAGLVLGGLSLTPAKAADLGGNCCADLEERVAELEATTARKSTRKVSLEIYGQVNRLLLAWDDGKISDAFVVDNTYSSTRVGFIGNAKLKEGWKAGYKIEIEYSDSSSANVSQFDDEGLTTRTAPLYAATELEDINAAIRIRQANWWIESEKLGRITVGQGSPSTDDIIIIQPGANTAFVSGDPLYLSGFGVRCEGSCNGTAPVIGGTFSGTFSGLTWGQLIGSALVSGSTLDTRRADVIRYDSPTIYGFIFSASWGENDFWDAAIWFKKEWNSIRVAFGIGYVEDEEVVLHRGAGSTTTPVSARFRTENEVKGSGFVQHIPSGVYVHAAGAVREYERRFPVTGAPFVDFDEEGHWWYLQVGINKRWLPYGATTVYVDYARYNDMAIGLSGLGLNLNLGADASSANDTVVDSEVRRWGFGVSQTFDAAALDLYAVFQFYDADVKAADITGVNTLGATGSRDLEDFWLVATGARIKF